MRNIKKGIYLLGYMLNKIFYKFIIMPIKKSMFVKCGKNIYIGRNSFFHYNNIYLGDDISIGEGAKFISSNAKIVINNKVMFGPNVTIITGDHRVDVLGKYMIDIYEKLPENDQDVIIENDVWIGCNSTILKGVTIGEGSVIAAGSVVNKNIEPYSIVGGVPAKKIKMRFSKSNIEEHKKILNV